MIGTFLFQNIIIILLGIFCGIVCGYSIRKRMYFKERIFHIMYIQHLERELNIPQDNRRYNFFEWDDNTFYEDDYVVIFKGSA